MSIIRQGTLPVGSLDQAITLNVQSSGGSHFETVTTTTPYLHRTSPQDASIMKLKKVVGGTIAWNQLVKNGNFVSGVSGWVAGGNRGTLSYADNVCSYTVTTVGTASYENAINQINKSIVLNHKYLMAVEINPAHSKKVFFWLIRNSASDGTNVSMQSDTLLANTWNRVSGIVASQTSYGYMQIALNTTSSTGYSVGDVDQLRNCVCFDLTQMFGSTIADYIYSLEQANTGDGVAWFKALFGEDYYPYNGGELLSVKTSARKTYNADNVEIGSYPLDNDLELRGIPKLDSNNNLYYDGDIYKSDGSVERRYGVVDLGTLDWTYVSANTRFEVSLSDAIPPSSNSVLWSTAICARYNLVVSTNISSTDKSYGMTRLGTLLIHDSAYTDAATFKTAMSGVYLVYELATPTTESADAYTESQRVGATEEFVDGRTVEMPVGNVSEYKRLIQGD